MEKPIVAGLNVVKEKQYSLIKSLPHNLVFGDSSKRPGTCSDILEYLLDQRTDSANPTPYTQEEADIASRVRIDLQKPRHDPNYNFELRARTREGNQINLDLSHPVAEYISEQPQSILLTKENVLGTQRVPYGALELQIENYSTGGQR